LRSFFDRIGSRDAINGINVLVVSITQAMSSMVASETNYNDRFLLFVACNLTAVAGLAIGLGIGALVMHKYSVNKSRPLLAISIILIASFMRSYIFDYLLIRFNFAEESQLAYRFYSSTIATAVIYLLLAYFVANARDIHLRNQKLVLITKQLRDAKEASINDLEIYRHALFYEIRERIDTALSQVKIQSSKQQQDLQRIIDDVIRPTSYELYKYRPATDEITEATISGGIALKDVTRQLIANRPYQTFITPVLTGMAAGMFLIPIFGAPSLSQLFLASTVAFCLLSFSNFMWDRYIQYSSFGRRLFIYCSITFMFATVISSFIVNSLPEGTPSPMVSISLWAAAATLTALPAFVAASITLQENINFNLNTTTSVLKSELASLNVLKFQFHKNAARTIHGPIQDIISIAISTMTKVSREFGLKEIQHMTHQIEDVWEVMNKSQHETISLNDYLRSLVEMWDVQSEITLNLDVEEVEIISRDQNTSMAIQELVREACSNSIRHGKATSIDVTMHLNQETMSVSLTVSDNGIGFDVASKTGLGTQIFDDFTISWDIHSNNGKTVVTAEIPFTEPAELFTLLSEA